MGGCRKVVYVCVFRSFLSGEKNTWTKSPPPKNPGTIPWKFRSCSVDRKRGQWKGATSKKPKIVKNIFDIFRQFSRRAKSVKNDLKVSKVFSTLFDSFQTAPVFRPLLGGSELCFFLYVLFSLPIQRRLLEARPSDRTFPPAVQLHAAQLHAETSPWLPPQCCAAPWFPRLYVGKSFTSLPSDTKIYLRPTNEKSQIVILAKLRIASVFPWTWTFWGILFLRDISHRTDSVIFLTYIYGVIYIYILFLVCY